MAWDDGMTHCMCGVGGCQYCHCHYCATAVREERDELRAQMERLEAALVRYGRHDEGCERIDKGWDCTCGFTEALKES